MVNSTSRLNRSTRPCSTQAARLRLSHKRLSVSVLSTLRTPFSSLYFLRLASSSFPFLPCRFISLGGKLETETSQDRTPGRAGSSGEPSVVFQSFADQTSNLLYPGIPNFSYPFSIACNSGKIRFSDRSSCLFRLSAYAPSFTVTKNTVVITTIPFNFDHRSSSMPEPRKARRKRLASDFAPHGHMVEPSIGTYFSLVGAASRVKAVVEVGST